MAQIFRIDNPVRGKGSRWRSASATATRCCTSSTACRALVFLTAPLAYLFFGAHVIHAS
jgi:cellulose synthase (UDP-forming)